jgi:primary-amine oxidase
MSSFNKICALALFGFLLAGQANAQEKPTEGGYPVKWEGWSFNWKVLKRQGVVLTDVKFLGRTVLKYAGVAEIFVPYNSGTPRPHDQRDTPFGDALVGLEPGVDCLPGGECQAFGLDGKPTKNKLAAVMIHEESPSLIYMGGNGKVKGKMLTLWSAYALGDYTYIVQWRFREDGCIMPQVGLTGKLSHFGGDDSNSVLVDLRTRALAHVHNFFFCLDFDIDGAKNTVEEFDFKVADKDGLTAKTSWTPIEKECGRELKPDAFRSWRVVNNLSRNRMGYSRSYELSPGGNGIYRGAKDEKFAHYDVWITKFKEKEVPGEKVLVDGLVACANSERVKNEDVVLWYMMSVHHQPKAEDWPNMPIDWCGFKITPRDFLNSSLVDPR